MKKKHQYNFCGHWMDNKGINKYSCGHNSDNTDEMDQVLESHNLLKLTQEKIDHLNRLLSINKLN